MANLAVTFEVEGTNEVAAMFGKSIQRSGDFRKPLEKSSKLMLKTFDQNFGRQGQTLGEPWKKRKKNYPWPMLEKTGAMRKSFNYDLDADQSTLSNEAPYFKYHQSNKPRKKLPRRIMMKIDEYRRRLIVKYIQEYIVKGQ